MLYNKWHLIITSIIPPAVFQSRVSLLKNRENNISDKKETYWEIYKLKDFSNIVYYEKYD